MLQLKSRVIHDETPEGKEAVVDMNLSAARDNFAHYRVIMNPRFMLKGYWFPHELAFKLRQFYADWQAGKRPVRRLGCWPRP